MDLLLDTHAFIWFLNGDNQLPTTLKNLFRHITTDNAFELHRHSGEGTSPGIFSGQPHLSPCIRVFSVSIKTSYNGFNNSIWDKRDA